jgi:CheY-like chemotaxis protein
VFSHSVPRVFVVDDEHVIASTLAAILKQHGYSATSFTSPQEALAAARSSAPDLLISDVLMPGLSGVDLAIQIKAQCPACKVLLFSGQATTRDLLKDARIQDHTFQVLQKLVDPCAMLAGSRTSSTPVPALPVKASSRILPMPRCIGTS